MEKFLKDQGNESIPECMQNVDQELTLNIATNLRYMCKHAGIRHTGCIEALCIGIYAMLVCIYEYRLHVYINTKS